MGLITEPNVQSFPIRLRKDHDRGDAEIPTGPNDPDRDLPTIGDKNFFEQVIVSCQLPVLKAVYSRVS